MLIYMPTCKVSPPDDRIRRSTGSQWYYASASHWTNKRLHPFPVREGGAPQVSLQGLTSVLLDISDVVAELPPTNGGPHPAHVRG